MLQKIESSAVAGYLYLYNQCYSCTLVYTISASLNCTLQQYQNRNDDDYDDDAFASIRHLVKQIKYETDDMNFDALH